MDEHENRVDLNSELGMSRRDLLRRGAVVGGTLLWVAPAIQSMSPNAFAAEPGASNACASCYCRWRNSNHGYVLDNCYSDGPTGIRESPEACAAWCSDPANPQNVEALGNGADPSQTQSDWCTGTRCTCVTGRHGPPIDQRAVCS